MRALLRSRNPLIWIVSQEESRVDDSDVQGMVDVLVRRSIEWLEKVMTDNILISELFWRTMPPEEFASFLSEQNGVLNAEQCARLWHIDGHDGMPPTALEVFFDRSDIEAMIVSGIRVRARKQNQ